MKLFNLIKIAWFRYRKEIEMFPVDYDEVINFLYDKFEDCETIEVEDTKYYACNHENAKRIAKLIPTYKLKYKEEFDCDNFSKLYWGISGLLFPRLPIGKCNVKTSKGLHALNFILYKSKLGRKLSFSFIEPQTGELKYFNYNPYLLIV